MITIANTVNTVDADLKIFFQALAEIAGNRDVDISRAKGELLAELRDENLEHLNLEVAK